MRNHFLNRLTVTATALLLASGVAIAAASGQSSYSAPAHTTGFPGLVGGDSQAEVAASLQAGPELERDRSPKWLLEDQRKLDKALAALGPQKPGVVDAYVVVVGLDSDPIFGREAREAGKVLSRRYGAVGHTIVLAGTDGSGPSTLPNGSPRNLAIALARVAELMDKKQDVLVLYTAGHGAKVGLAYHDADDGFGIIPPARLARLFDELGIQNRLLILSACFSGIFVPTLANDNTALFTAASAERTSFGCQSDKDWTFYGDAMINHALRQPVPLAKAGEDAFLRGLFHSDGCRITNWTVRTVAGEPKRYEYPRWFFSNESDDILGLCSASLDRLGIAHRRPRPNMISVARREAVEIMDRVIGPKT